MIKNINIFYIIIVIALILIINVIIKQNNTNNKSSNNYINKVKYEKAREIRAQYIGKRINFVNDFIDDTLFSTNKYLLLVTEYDCTSCIKQGFKLLTLIDSKYGQNKYSIIISSFDRNLPNAKYTDMIVYDTTFQVGKKLNFIPTPVIIKYVSSFIIMDLFLPDLDNNSNFYNFIN
ncbi:MAG: hypothetical protein K9N00_00425 [Candidatus Marinimicrobia bacterium]|nr:hypothetical protein [Candidatus Neomarinimicrobiota bacterium]